MSDRLQILVAAARAEQPAFNAPRSLGRALKKKGLRARRDRIVRRSAIAVSGAGLFASLVLWAFVAPASTSGASASAVTEAVSTDRQEIAAHALDAGFARD